MIHITVRISHFSGLNLLMDAKLNSSPSGRANTSVSENSFAVVARPLSRYSVTLTNIVSANQTAGQLVLFGKCLNGSVGVQLGDDLIDLGGHVAALAEADTEFLRGEGIARA